MFFYCDISLVKSLKKAYTLKWDFSPMNMNTHIIWCIIITRITQTLI